MPKKTTAKAPATKRSTARRKTAKAPPPLLDRFRKEAESLQKQLSKSAQTSIRQLEEQFLHQLHAATEEQVKRLERRVSALEKKLDVKQKARAAGAGSS